MYVVYLNESMRDLQQESFCLWAAMTELACGRLLRRGVGVSLCGDLNNSPAAALRGLREGLTAAVSLLCGCPGDCNTLLAACEDSIFCTGRVTLVVVW